MHNARGESYVKFGWALRLKVVPPNSPAYCGGAGGRVMVLFRSVRAGALAFVMCSVPAMAHAETLREALTSAYLNNPTILSALLNVKATAENIAIAKSAKLPQIGAQASITDSYTAGFPPQMPVGSVGASISQNIFDYFKNDADVEAARALTEASRYSLSNSAQNILLNVVQAYMGVVLGLLFVLFF